MRVCIFVHYSNLVHPLIWLNIICKTTLLDVAHLKSRSPTACSATALPALAVDFRELLRVSLIRHCCKEKNSRCAWTELTRMCTEAIAQQDKTASVKPQNFYASAVDWSFAILSIQRKFVQNMGLFGITLFSVSARLKRQLVICSKG